MENKKTNFKEMFFAAIMLTMLLFVSCTPYYIAANFDSLTTDHKKVAILPFEVIFTGVIPKEITEEDILAIEEAESSAFQISFYKAILRSTKSGKKLIRIDLQHFDKTLDLLNENGIGIRESWRRNSEELAGILGVDAVVKARIEKTRFMSDLASFGIEMGIDIVNILTDNRLWPWISSGAVKAKEVRSEFYLLDKQDDLILWSISYDIDADWRRSANEIIDEINRKSARKFPYRIK